mmetsp:Transcript_22193/g.27439  ORF Transcript_22193/g.27439 Transcript_22193/m.27439 type:complete len:87 (-) Transcript_22193:51-311(-)
MCSMEHTQKVPLRQPQFGVHPNWVGKPHSSAITNKHSHNTLFSSLETMSSKLTPRDLLGLERSPDLGTGERRPKCHSPMSRSSSSK